MNNARRKELETALPKLREAAAIVRKVRQEEDTALENLGTGNLAETRLQSRLFSNATNMDEILKTIDEAIDLVMNVESD